jgi:predicted SprT family Zn-dependent metalloprotease
MKEENRVINLSKEELAQLKGGEEMSSLIPAENASSQNEFLQIFAKNKNSAYKCKCDNRPVSISNLNKTVECTCYCTPG